VGHSVRLIIGTPAAIQRFVAAWPQTNAVPLQGNWSAAPVNDDLYDAIEAAAHAADREPSFDMAPRGLAEAMAAITAGVVALAYVETEYFGGTGDQSGGAWIGGEARCAARGHGSINSALHAIGVADAEGMDAFDTIGLGRRRSMDDYAPSRAIPAAPRPDDARSSAAGAGLPLWLVVGVIAAAIGLGLAVGLIA